MQELDRRGLSPPARPPRDEGRRSSLYLSVRDGVQIALDVHLPSSLDVGQRAPTMLRQTRYYRSVELPVGLDRRWARDLFDLSAPTRERFLGSGYAWVDVDVRGSGVSSGSWPLPWSPEEVLDGREVVDFIVRQPWSNGLVGSTGISYEGTTADMLLVHGHPAVRAIAPRFSLFDAYEDVAHPGGIQLSWFTDGWSRFNRLLDDHRYHAAMAELVHIIASANASGDAVRARLEASVLRRLGPARAKRMISMAFGALFRGGRRVDEDGGGLARSRSLRDHDQNGDVHDLVGRGEYHDDVLPDRADLHFDAVSPRGNLELLRASGAAVFSYGGWLDGAYGHAALSRFTNVGGAGGRALIGPWGHAGVVTHEAFERGRASTFDHDGELLRFFDLHLREGGEGLGGEARVRYFVFGGGWRAATTWPPEGLTAASFTLGPDRTLRATGAANGRSGADGVPHDAEARTGERSRWRGVLAGFVPADYPDLAPLQRELVAYESPPLDAPLELTGHATLRLWIRASAAEATVFAYLVDVAPDGRHQYVTEGQLRATHRALAPTPTGFVALRPHRTHARGDASPLDPGVPTELVFGMLPTAYLFAAGHRVRLALATADADHFALPKEDAGGFEVLWGGATPSRVELPARRAGSS